MPPPFVERTAEDRYTDLLRHLAAPSVVDPEGLVESMRQVQHLHSMGHITAGQLADANAAYAATIERDPKQGPPRSPEIRDDER